MYRGKTPKNKDELFANLHNNNIKINEADGDDI